MQDRHRQVECDVCSKPMRSNNLKCHKKTHKNLLSLPHNEIKVELKNREEIQEKAKRKDRKIKLWKLQKRMT